MYYILLYSVSEQLKGVTFEKLSAEQKELVIKEFVIKEIASKEAKKRKLNKDADYKEALKNFESELLKQKLVFALIKEASDEKNVKKNYDELVESHYKSGPLASIALNTPAEFLQPNTLRI